MTLLASLRFDMVQSYLRTELLFASKATRARVLENLPISKVRTDKRLARFVVLHPELFAVSYQIAAPLSLMRTFKIPPAIKERSNTLVRQIARLLSTRDFNLTAYPAILASAPALAEMACLFPTKFVSENSDNEIAVLAGVAHDGFALSRASLRLRTQENVVRVAVAKNGMAIIFAHASFADHDAIATLAVTEDPFAYGYLSERLCDHGEITLPVVSKYGTLLKHASKRLRNMKTYALAAVMQNKEAYEWVGPDMKRDPDVCRAAEVPVPDSANPYKFMLPR